MAEHVKTSIGIWAFGTLGTHFMETLEVARALRKVQWRFIDGVAGKLDGTTLAQTQQEKDVLAAYRVVFTALGMDPAMARLAAHPPTVART